MKLSSVGLSMSVKGNALGQASNSTGITGLARSWLRLSPRLLEVDFRLASASSSPAVISPPRMSLPIHTVIHCHSQLPLLAHIAQFTHTQASLSSLPVHALLSLCLADLLLPLTVVVVVVVVFTRLAAFTAKSG